MLISICLSYLPLPSPEGMETIFIGNPELTLEVDDGLSSVAIYEAALQAHRVVAVTCSGEDQVLPGAYLDLVNGELSLPVGAWCGLRFEGVHLEAWGDEQGAARHREQDLPVLDVDFGGDSLDLQALDPTARALRFGLEGWLVAGNSPWVVLVP